MLWKSETRVWGGGRDKTPKWRLYEWMMHFPSNKHQRCWLLQQLFIIIRHGFLFWDKKAEGKIMYKREKISANRASVSDTLHNRHLSDRGRTDGYMTLLLPQEENPLVLMSYKLLRSPGSSTSFLLLLFKSSFPIQTLIFPVQRRKQQKPTYQRQWIRVKRQGKRLDRSCWLCTTTFSYEGSRQWVTEMYIYCLWVVQLHVFLIRHIHEGSEY